MKRTLGLFLLLLTLALPAPTVLAEDTAVPAASRPARSWPLEWNRTIPLQLESTDVAVDGTLRHLVHLGSIRFELDPASHRLTAIVPAGLTCSDNVEHELSAAVLDEAGELLGTARVTCRVETLILGRVVTASRKLELDFRTSLDYPRASRFALSISKARIANPPAAAGNK